jgi:hypothetical protein
MAHGYLTEWGLETTMRASGGRCGGSVRLGIIAIGLPAKPFGKRTVTQAM